MEFAIGQRVGDYEIESLIGTGGMGRVYRVRNTISHRTEAMKVLLSDLSAEPELAARFLSEIRTLATLDHPHIAQLHTAMQTGNELIMMMEFVDGYTLQELARQAPLAPPKIVDYVHQVLAALSYAHSRGVIHRDVKPANIMVTPNGMVKLTDFGIAKSKLKDELTRPGTTVGSLNYMSPEQALGGCPIDGRADLYSLGITMYELLAGSRPFEDESAYVVLHRQLNAEPRPPADVNPLLSQALSDLILKALEKDPSRRFQNAAAFSQALREVTGIAASTPARSYPAITSVSRSVPDLPAAAAELSNGKRGRVRIAAGVSAVIGAIVLAVVTVPHFLGTGASAKTVAHSADQPASLSSPDPGQTAPSGGKPLTATIPATPIVDRSDEGGTPTVATVPPEETAASRDEPYLSILPPDDIGITDRHPTGGASVTALARSQNQPRRSAEPKRARAEYKTASLGNDMPQREEDPPTVTSRPAKTASSAELLQLRDQTVIEDARAAKLRTSVQRLKSQREAAGEALNQDVANAYVRMNAYLSAEKIDLEDGDAAAARDHLEKANLEENNLDKLFSQ